MSAIPHLGSTPEKYRYSTDGNLCCEFDEGTPLVCYGDMLFVRLCPHCARFVKADDSVAFNDEYGPVNQPNATCKKHGRVKMPFEGWRECDW